MLYRRTPILLTLVLVSSITALAPALADDTPQALPYAQDWSDPDLITNDDDWSGVAGVIGYRGDGLANVNADPRAVLADGASTPVDVVEGSVATSSTGGVHELSGTIGMQGSGRADAPHLVLRLDTTGAGDIGVSFTATELDGKRRRAADRHAVSGGSRPVSSSTCPVGTSLTPLTVPG